MTIEQKFKFCQLQSCVILGKFEYNRVKKSKCEYI